MIAARRAHGVLTAATCAALLLAGCSGSGSGSTSSGQGGGGGGSGSHGGSHQARPSARAVVSVQPADRASDVAPATPIVVTASKGTLTDVAVSDTHGARVTGHLDAAKTTWTSSGTLAFGTTYRVAASAANDDGDKTTSNATFTTATARAMGYDAVAPLAGQTVGVGYPIRVYFKQHGNDQPLPVANRAEVEKHLKVTTTPAQEGAWHWFANGTEAHWRPKEYWAAGTRVTLSVDLNGVELAKGVFAERSRQVTFRIGAEHVSIADAKTHRLRVYTDDKLVRDFPASLGKEVKGRYTHGGPHVVITKNAVKHMDSTTFGLALDAGGYTADVKWATRISNSGEFVHAAPWSVAQQGHSNVSHGCVNLSEANAKWFFDFSQVGDVVNVVNSPVKFTEKDGDIFDWTIPWDQWTRSS